MLFNKNVRKPIIFLEKYLQECGYTAEPSKDENNVLDVHKEGRYIGTYELDGTVQLMEHSAGEREKLQNIRDFTFAFVDCPPAYLGQWSISEYESTAFTADIDPQSGKPVYYVYQADDPINSKEDFAPYAFASLDDAKLVYAERAGLASPSTYAQREQESISAKHIEILQQNGYHLKHSPDVEKSWGLYKGENAVGYIDKSLHVVVTTQDKLVAENMGNLRDRAKWEVGQASDGQSIFTKKLADALIRLGFNVQNVWQKLQMQMGIFRDGKQVALVNPHDQIEYQPKTPAKFQKQIETAKTQVQGDIQKEYEMYQKAMETMKTKPVSATKAEPAAQATQKAAPDSSPQRQTLEQSEQVLPPTIQEEQAGEKMQQPPQSRVSPQQQAQEQPAQPPVTQQEQLVEEKSAHGEPDGLHLSISEIYFIKAMIESDACRTMAANHGLENITVSIDKKLCDSFPQIPYLSHGREDALAPVEEAQEEQMEL